VSNGQEYAIEVRGLDHYFDQGERRERVLHEINLAIRPGELVIMTGPSGCGKTTLLTLIGGLRRVQHGTIRVLEHELTALDDRPLVEVRKGIGFIFQLHNLFESLTAIQNVRMALELHPGRRRAQNQRAAEALEAVGLKRFLKVRPPKLSGGQRQRVAIARALVNRPRLILADEPTAALDAESTVTVMDLLRDLTRQGVTVLIVTHDVKIMKLADRIVDLDHGRIKSNVLVDEAVRRAKALARCPEFAMLKPGEITFIADRMKSESYPAGAVVVRQGATDRKFFVLDRGQVEVHKADEQGTSRQVAILVEGDVFGEMSLLEGSPRNATVIAQTDLTVYTLDAPDFHAARASVPSFREQILGVYLQRQ
jgi:putative ABC transport system ATP-binding protein